MARIKGKSLVFKCDAPDAVAYNVYYQKDGPVGYTSPFVLIPDPSPNAGGEVRVAIPDQIPIQEGQYQIGVSALDGQGNETDISQVVDYFFDFTAPSVPYDLRIE